MPSKFRYASHPSTVSKAFGSSEVVAINPEFLLGVGIAVLTEGKLADGTVNFGTQLNILLICSTFRRFRHKSNYVMVVADNIVRNKRAEGILGHGKLLCV